MAVTITAADLATATGATATVAARLLPVATEIVTRYTGTATVPDAIHNEAVIRTVGWLADTPSAGMVAKVIGDREYAHLRQSMTAALRSSGAMSLLRPYKPLGFGVAE